MQYKLFSIISIMVLKLGSEESFYNQIEVKRDCCFS